MKKTLCLFLILVLVFSTTGCWNSKSTQTETLTMIERNTDEIVNNVINDDLNDQVMENLYAFSRLYGYLRFFHPSKESENLNWENYVVYGVSQVKLAKNEEELLVKLNELMSPIAPTARLSTDPNLDYTYLDTTKQKGLYAWQHKGGVPDHYFQNRVDASKNKPIYGWTPIFMDFRSDKEQYQTRIFESFPMGNEMIKEQISKSIYTYIPLALEKKDAVIDEEISEELLEFENKVNAYEEEDLTIANQDVRLANVIIAWNAIQHFYPNFTENNMEWEKVLVPTMQDAINEQTKEEYDKVISQMARLLDDSNAYMSTNNTTVTRYLPLRIEKVEGNYMVTQSDSPMVEVGDYVLSIDGTPVSEKVYSIEQTLGGSPQYKHYLALLDLVGGVKDEETTWVFDRQGQTKEVTFQYKLSNPPIHYNHPKSYTEVDDGIYYIRYFDKAFDILEFKKIIRKDQDIKGFIFENREKSKKSTEVYELIRGTLIPVEMIRVQDRYMLTVYPDRKAYTWENQSAVIPNPAEEAFDIPCVFLVDESTATAAESIAGTMDLNNVGQLVGRPTAGVGLIKSTITLFDGYRLTFSGKYQSYADGTELHSRGIQPDVVVEKTMEDVLGNKDELIEKAIEILNKK